MDLKTYYLQKKRAIILRRFIISTLIAGIFFIVAWGIFWVPFLRIENIDVKNYPDIAAIKNKLMPYFNSKSILFLPANNFFLVSGPKIADLLKSDGFGLAEVEKKFPKTLVINFVETKPWLIFCEGEQCFYVDQNGVLANTAPKFSENPLPEIIIPAINNTQKRLGDSLLSEPQTEFFRTAFENLQTLGAETAKVELDDVGDAKIFLKEGWFIYVPLNSDPQKIFSDLKLLLGEKIKDGRGNLEYIDLRFENKAFYKLKSIN